MSRLIKIHAASRQKEIALLPGLWHIMQKPQCPVKISTYLDWIPAWELVGLVGLVGLIMWKLEVSRLWTIGMFFICCLLVVSQIPTFLSLPNRWVRLCPVKKCMLPEVWHFSRRWLPAVEKELVKTQQVLLPKKRSVMGLHSSKQN